MVCQMLQMRRHGLGGRLDILFKRVEQSNVLCQSLHIKMQAQTVCFAFTASCTTAETWVGEIVVNSYITGNTNN